MSVLEYDGCMGRPLRKDAERNRERIVGAARELFAEAGLGVTLHDVARRAGLGVGTVYRHFADKGVLIESLFDEQLERIVEIYESGLDDPDPWHALVSVHERALELQAEDRGLRELLAGAPHAPARATRQRARLHPIAAKLVERGKAAGVVRADCETQDFGVVMMMVATVIDAAAEVNPDLWRRYLRLALQGLRAQGAPLDHPSVRAVRPRQMDELVLGAWTRRRP